MHHRPAGRLVIAEVIREAAPALLGFFVRRVEAAEDAADLVSQTLEAAVRTAARMPKDRHEARLWLFGIARNVLRHHERSTRRRDALVRRLGHAIDESRLPDQAEVLDVRRAVSALPPDLAELIRLVHWDGFSVEDAARHLGINASTARSRHARAKQILRGALATTTSRGEEEIGRTAVHRSG